MRQLYRREEGAAGRKFCGTLFLGSGRPELFYIA